MTCAAAIATAAHALRGAGRTPVVLKAGDEPVGSWPSYYESLTLFSPARYSALPGMAFPGDPDHYPHRDEVMDYLRRYAMHFDDESRWTSAPAEHLTAVQPGRAVPVRRRPR